MRFLALVGTLAILLAIGLGVYFFGGYYNVAASAEDPGPVRWALARVRSTYISRHAGGQAPFPIDDQAAIQAGARNFARYGCANCHGGPGVGWAKFSEGLNPGPPDLKDTAKDDSAAKIFWVIKNGIRMTAMPSFAKAGVPDNEIWQIAAFVKKLPGVSDADYKTWTTTPAQ